MYAVGNGPVGLEDEQNITHPLPIETLNNENMTEIASGNLHTLALDENKQVVYSVLFFPITDILIYEKRYGVGEVTDMVH